MWCGGYYHFDGGVLFHQNVWFWWKWRIRMLKKQWFFMCENMKTVKNSIFWVFCLLRRPVVRFSCIHKCTYLRHRRFWVFSDIWDLGFGVRGSDFGVRGSDFGVSALAVMQIGVPGGVPRPLFGVREVFYPLRSAVTGGVLGVRGVWGPLFGVRGVRF